MKKKEIGMVKCGTRNRHKTQVWCDECNSSKIKDTTSIKDKTYWTCSSCSQKKVNRIGKFNGLSKHTLYNTWSNMIQRCYNENNREWSNYGGRGVYVTSEWEKDYLSFYTWAINSGWKSGLTLDRKNNDLEYSPNNCRWITQSEQMMNTRIIKSTNKSGFRGVSVLRNSKYRAAVGIKNKTIVIGTFTNALEAAKARDKYIEDNNLSHTRNSF